MNNRQVNHEITLSRLATDKLRKDLRQAQEKATMTLFYLSATAIISAFVF